MKLSTLFFPLLTVFSIAAEIADGEIVSAETSEDIQKQGATQDRQAQNAPKKAPDEIQSTEIDDAGDAIEKEKEVESAVVKQEEPKTINKIVLMIYTDEDPIIVTQHDLNCKSLDGRVRSEEEIIFERLAYWEALHVYKMAAPEESVDKHLASIREQHGVSDEEIKKLFKESGYTFEEGKEQLRISYTLQRLLQELITSRIVVTESEIKEYHEKHPIKEPASFRVQKGFISIGKMTKEELKVLIDDGEGQEEVEWSNPYWLNEDEIADHKKFILSMRPGEISKPEKCEGGFEVVKLIKRRKEHSLALEERYAEIANQLKLPKYEKMLADYREKLLKKYEVVHYN